MSSTPRTEPPFRADHVGSLIRPPELRAARTAWMNGELDRAALTEIEDRCITDVIQMQENVGLTAVTDGEFRRSSWRDGFFDNLDGFSKDRAATSFEFKMAEGGTRPNREVPSVVGKLKRRNPIAVDEFRFVKAQTTVLPKVTLPAPSVMHFFRGDAIVDKSVYPSIDAYMADVTAIYREEIAALADEGCTYLQIDEVALPVMCDLRIRQTIEARGEDPNKLIDLYVDSINDAISAAPGDMTVCLHMCKGNVGEGMGEGSYEPIAERLFTDLRVDGYFMEYDTARAGDFTPLRHMPDDKIVSLGLMSTKTSELEPVDGLVSRIREASKFVDKERLCLCPQCGFASGYQTDRLTIDEQMAKFRRLVETAEIVWN